MVVCCGNGTTDDGDFWDLVFVGEEGEDTTRRGDWTPFAGEVMRLWSFIQPAWRKLARFLSPESSEVIVPTPDERENLPDEVFIPRILIQLSLLD